MQGGIDVSIKVRRIKYSLSGAAKLYVRNIGPHLISDVTLWSYLDERYRDQWDGNLKVVNQFIDLMKTPITNIRELMKYPDIFHNLDLLMEQKNFTRKQSTTTIFLASLPGEMRNDIIKSDKIDKPGQHIYTWADIGKIAHDAVETLSDRHDYHTLANFSPKFRNLG